MPRRFAFSRVVIGIAVQLTALTLPAAASEPTDTRPTAELVSNLITWLGWNVDLPTSAEPPRVELVAEAGLATIRYRSFFAGSPQAVAIESTQPLQSFSGRDVVGVYDDRTRTIYLRDDWRADRPADVSVLVHELVHHLQNEAGRIYNCPAEREKLAFAAQEKWLSQNRLSLESAFELDGFTLLVRTNCGF